MLSLLLSFVTLNHAATYQAIMLTLYDAAVMQEFRAVILVRRML